MYGWHKATLIMSPPRTNGESSAPGNQPRALGLKAFQALGVFILEDFLQATRLRLTEVMRDCRVAKKATVYQKGARGVHETERKTKLVEVGTDLRSIVEAELENIRPDIANHFKTTLSGMEPPQFLRYERGDFFSKHVDAGTKKYRNRRVSVIIYVNDPNASEQGYTGGNLLFYGLLPDPNFKRAVLPLQPKAGLLVAFPSNLMHEVAPVTGGVRLSIATWYLHAHEPVAGHAG